VASYEKPPLGRIPHLPPVGWLLPAAQPIQGVDVEPPSYEFSFDTSKPFGVEQDVRDRLRRMPRG
jgi:hypothetical protein